MQGAECLRHQPRSHVAGMNIVGLTLPSRTSRSHTMSWQLTRGCFALLVCWSCPCSLLWLRLLPFLRAGLHEKQTALRHGWEDVTQAQNCMQLASAIVSIASSNPGTFMGQSTTCAHQSPLHAGHLGTLALLPWRGRCGMNAPVRILLTFSAFQSKPAMHGAGLVMSLFNSGSTPSKSNAMRLNFMDSVAVAHDISNTCIRTNLASRPIAGVQQRIDATAAWGSIHLLLCGVEGCQESALCPSRTRLQQLRSCREMPALLVQQL